MIVFYCISIKNNRWLTRGQPSVIYCLIGSRLSRSFLSYSGIQIIEKQGQQPVGDHGGDGDGELPEEILLSLALDGDDQEPDHLIIQEGPGGSGIGIAEQGGDQAHAQKNRQLQKKLEQRKPDAAAAAAAPGIEVGKNGHLHQRRDPGAAIVAAAFGGQHRQGPPGGQPQDVGRGQAADLIEIKIQAEHQKIARDQDNTSRDRMLSV